MIKEIHFESTETTSYPSFVLMIASGIFMFISFFKFQFMLLFSCSFVACILDNLKIIIKEKK